MNEELQKQIASMLQSAMTAVQKGGEWLGGQIPDVLHQLIVWTITLGIVNLFLCIFTWLIIYKSWNKFLTYCRGTDSSGEVIVPWGMVNVGLSIVNLVVTSIYYISNISDALKAYTAPKLFLLEYAAHLVK